MGITEKVGRIRRRGGVGVGGALKFAWKMKSSRNSSNVISGDHFSEVTFKGGLAKFHLV